MNRNIRLLSVLMALFVAIGNAWADDITPEQALQIALRFTESNPQTRARAKAQAKVPSAQPRLAHAVKSKSSQKDNVYVINLGENQGFVIVAGDDGADNEVLGYCENGTFEFDKAPIQMKELLDNYSQGVDKLREASQPKATSKTHADNTPSFMGTVVVGPLLTTAWNQWAPYNNLCPDGCPSGCVPTAVAQVLNYWKWPKQTIGNVQDEDFSGHTYDWDNMLDIYGDYFTPAQGEAVAKLMADIGKTMHTRYTPEGSSTHFNSLPLVSNFNFAPEIATAFGKTGEDIIGEMKADLDQLHPILYCGYPEQGDAHALVVDGYTSKNYFHFNYGWGGYCDGWYRNGVCYNYCFNCVIIANIHPYDAERITIDNIEYGCFPNGTAEILNYKLEKQRDIDLTIPNTITDNEGNIYKVERIRNNAFTLSYSNFNTVTIGDNIKQIESGAFYNNTIETLILSDKMEVIPDGAFELTKIKNLTIGANVKHIGARAFNHCTLSKVTCKSPAFTTGEYAFGGTTPDCGEWLDHITVLGDQAFAGARSIKSLHFAQLTEIGSRCFDGVSEIEWTFTIPPTVKHVAPDAFVNSGIGRVLADETSPYFANKNYAVLCNKNMTSLVLTSMPSAILDADWFPETMVRMEEGSISERGWSTRDADGKYNYKSVTIPNTVEDITGAFTRCGEKVGTIYCLAIVPPTATDETFNDKMFEYDPDRELHVPVGTETLYRSAPGWRRFRNIIADQDFVTPPPSPARQYYMVLHCSGQDKQDIRIPVADVKNIRVGDYVDGTLPEFVISQNAASDNAYRVDSITWTRGFVMGEAEIFQLSPDNLVAKAQNCTVTLSPTILEEEVELAIRESVSLPSRPEGTLRSLAFDISLSNGQHELEGVAKIVIPFSVKEGNCVQAGYYDEESCEWKPVLAIYDEHRQELTIYTNHFTQFCALEVKELATTYSMITGLDCYETTLSLIEVLNHAKEILTEGKDPDTEAIDKWKDEASFWQSIGIDGGYSVLQGLGFSAEHVDNAVGIVGWLGTAMTFFDLIRASYNDDNLGVAVNSLKVINSVSAAYIGTVVGTQLLSLSMGGLAFVGIALEKFGTKMQERKKDYIRGVYRLYYSEKGNEIAGKKVCLSTTDWRKKLYPLFKRPDMNMDRLNLLIEAYVRQYTEAFWREDNDVYTWLMGAYTEMKKPWDFTSFLNVRESEQKEISEEFFAELMNGQMVSVIQAIKNDLEYEQWEEYQKYMGQFAAFMNSKIGIDITDSSCKEGEASEYDGWTIRFTEVPNGIEDKHRLVTTINSEGRARMGFYTLHSFITNKIKRQLTLVDPYGEEQRTFDFDIPGADVKTIIKIDLATMGQEVESIDRLHILHKPDYDDVFTPYHVVEWTTNYTYNRPIDYLHPDGTISTETQGKDKGEFEFYIPFGDLQGNYVDDYQIVRFQTEVERFFNNHEDFEIDNLGNYCIGGDIKGKFEHGERNAKGKFTIKTSYSFMGKTPEQFIYDWNNKESNPERFLNNIQSGTIVHNIECEYTITRNERTNEYQIVYEGNGTYDLTGQGITHVNAYGGVIDPSKEYVTLLEIRNLTMDNVTIGPLRFPTGKDSHNKYITSDHGTGTVTLSYTKKFKKETNKQE